MTEWLEDNVAAIGLLKTQNFNLVDRFWINWRPDEALRWKGEDHRLERSRSSVWEAGTFKAVALAYVN
jgi:hypothetical protein